LAADSFVRTTSSRLTAVAYLDKLVCLAEAVGVLAVENPEQGDGWGQNIYVDPDELVESIEAAIGVPLLPPPGAITVEGLDTKRGALHYRHINALYAALLVRRAVPVYGAICEYGGGLGLVGLYSRALGLGDYTLFDLPIANLLAGHFLMNSLGGDAVRLYGEDSSPTAIKVLPYWTCLEAPANAYTLSLNQDSFPEIDEEMVRRYLGEIVRTTRRHFLSINQEATARMTNERRQLALPRILREIPAFRLTHRAPCWVRSGYVEELYSIDVASDPTE